MVLVRLYKQEKNKKHEEGNLEFYGIEITEPADGSVMKFEGDGARCFEANGKSGRCSGQVKLSPAGVATDSEIKEIAEALCCNETSGVAGRYEWKMIPTTP